jgi:muconolactone D-isomerase
MLFHVKMTVDLPRDLDESTVEELNEREHARARELQEAGKWLHLWRVAGKFENVSVFSVEDPGELHDILSSLPLYPFMSIEVTALCRHPGAIAYP